MVQFYKCFRCGSVVAKINGVGCVPSCCGEPMKELKAGVVEASAEKHIPVAKIEGGKVEVCVGSIAHPMAPEHFIEWVYLETDKGGSFVFLKPGEEPKALFALLPEEKPVAVYAYCNLHGLWKSEL